MEPFKITLYGNPILRKKTQRVDFKDPSLKEIIERMFLTADIYGGIGLAANQVGLLHRLFIMNYIDEDNNRIRRVFLNPEIVQSSGNIVIEEGCLSFPGIRLEISRPEFITMKYVTTEGETVIEDLKGMLARVAQHETDHLNGVYFIDRVSSIRRKMLRKKLKEIAEGKIQPPVNEEFLTKEN